jgi:hypothetical protein
MGLFTSLFSPKVQQKPAVKKELVMLIGNAKFELEITGEERFQTALEAICGPRSPRGVNRLETAWLILEDLNPRDKNAVCVVIRGKRIGYLSPETAIQYRRQLIARGKPRADGQCQAVIKGGWISSDGRKGPYCVWLDIPSSDQ